MIVKLYEDIRVHLTYHSNAIERNSLDLRETQFVIEHGLTIGGHTVREHLEALHHVEAYSLLRHSHPVIDEAARSEVGAKPAAGAGGNSIGAQHGDQEHREVAAGADESLLDRSGIRLSRRATRARLGFLMC